MIAETLFTEKKLELSSQIRSFNEIDSRLKILSKTLDFVENRRFSKKRAFQK